jgi:hypothetical protein
MYQQEVLNHIVKDGKFVLVDRDEVADSILKNIDIAFEKHQGKDENLSIERTYDPVALNQAMCRYSRDVFGEARLHARILYIHEKYKIDKEDMKELIAFEDYGFKIDSCYPYVHRKISYLFYWFSVFKPFRVIPKPPIENGGIYRYLENHNEYMTYILVIMVLDCLNMTINIHQKQSVFNKFLYDLHNRKLSRSALEFFLSHHIFLKKGGAYPLTVQSIDIFAKKAIGIYRLGIFTKSTFAIKRIGRSDENINQSLKEYLDKGYTHFNCTYNNDSTAAYTNECLLYHHYTDAGYKLDNENHPEKPKGTKTSLMCPICGK